MRPNPFAPARGTITVLECFITVEVPDAIVSEASNADTSIATLLESSVFVERVSWAVGAVAAKIGGFDSEYDSESYRDSDEAEH
ncbi:hypothetical protein N7537_004579 [Penicillium hordei]|uniref:Uncharacterized protein n=1 Tax=Penicillium hordei TaxID=40994 RepID=A0AAD6ECQ4_9EURO|nr:uncharacterized protein N7537_004579 [Penicillium hordei]KAJ5607960.1 hypothetical protein N7537_004579 [Penicillium hordei]